MIHQGAFFLTCKVPSELNNQIYLDAGLKFINDLITYECTNPLLSPNQTCQYEVRRYQDKDYRHVLNVSSGAFRNSRFHQDERISFSKAEEIKSQWIISNLTSRNDVETFVVTSIESRETPIGYVSFLVTEFALIIDLIAIRNNFRRKGLGRLLVLQVLKEAQNRGLRVRVGTQSENPAAHLYLSLGFSPTSTESVFHYLNEMIK
jgi:ribosomal protein S18 acetylase RimI-like enzyme